MYDKDGLEAKTLMAVELTYPHIEKSGAEPAHLQRIPRIRVAQIVMDYLAHGWSPEEMRRQHPHLLRSEVHGAMRYYFDRQPEIDSEIKLELDAVEASRPNEVSPILLRMRTQGIL